MVSHMPLKIKGWAQSTMNDRVSPFVRDLCHMDRVGGRCIRVDASSWELLDVQQWTEDHTTALRRRFPSLTTRIVTNRKSLSGFSILVQAQKATHIWISLLVCAAMIASSTALAYTMNSKFKSM